MFEELSDGDLEASAPGAGDHLDRLDGVAAELEKVVEDTDPVELDDVGADTGEDRPNGRARGDITPRFPRSVRWGEDGPDHLAVRRLRRRIRQTHHRRNPKN